MMTKLVLGAIAVAVVAASMYWFTAHRRRARLDLRRREVQFWKRLLAPLFAHPEGEARDNAIAELCEDRHAHPRLGSIAIEPDDVRRRMLTMPGQEPTRRPIRRTRTTSAKMETARNVDPKKQLEVDIFWCQMLGPLRKMDTLERDCALRELSSRSHHHPHLGKQFIDRSILQQQYQRIRRMKLKELQEQLVAMENGGARPSGGEQAAESVAAAAPEAAQAETLPRDFDEPETVPEQMFWFDLLADLKEIPARLRGDRFEELSGESHHHPIEGNRIFSKNEIRRAFAWVQSVDAETLKRRWSEAALSDLDERADADAGDGSDETVDALFDETATAGEMVEADRR